MKCLAVEILYTHYGRYKRLKSEKTEKAEITEIWKVTHMSYTYKSPKYELYGVTANYNYELRGE